MPNQDKWEEISSFSDTSNSKPDLLEAPPSPPPAARPAVARTKLLRPLAMVNLFHTNPEDKTKGEVMSGAFAQLFSWPPFSWPPFMLMAIWFPPVGEQSTEGMSTLAAQICNAKKLGATEAHRRIAPAEIEAMARPGLGFQQTRNPCEHGRGPDGPICRWCSQPRFGCSNKYLTVREKEPLSAAAAATAAATAVVVVASVYLKVDGHGPLFFGR